MGLKHRSIFLLFVVCSAAFTEPTYPELGSGDFFYQNRKTVLEPDLFFSRLITQTCLKFASAGRSVRVFDFNPGPDSGLAYLNIVDEAASKTIGSACYRTLSPQVLESAIFRPFLERLLAPPLDPGLSSILHIDHHYPYETLRTTSTSVLLLDFLLWVHDQKDRGKITDAVAREVLNRFADSFGIMDHSDADILLPQFIALNARNASLLRANEALFKGIVLYNDHLLETGTAALPQEKIWLALQIIQVTERKVASGQLSYPAAISRIPTLLAFLDRLGSTDHRQRAAALKPSEFSPEEAWIAESLQQVLVKSSDESRRIDQLVETASRAKPFAPGNMYLRPPLLVVYLDEDDGEVLTSSAICAHLGSRHANLLNGVAAVLTVSPNAQTGATLLKLRSMSDDLDLNPIYFELNKPEIALDAGGRATAGSAAYGKSGRRVSNEVLERDVETIVRVIGQSCAMQLAARR